jgi:hypothetical protein
MNTPGFEPTRFEQQVGMALLAHVARGDTEAVSASLACIQDPTGDLRPAYVIATLLHQFRVGMENGDSRRLATWFVNEAQSLAEEQSAA